MKKMLTLFLCVFIIHWLTGCVTQMNQTTYLNSVAAPSFPVSGTTSRQARNLQKLCKVWGFTKYTHQSFLLGLKDWDEELLSLIPIVYFANDDDVNGILYDWFIGLGDDGYDYIKPSIESPENKHKRYMAETDWITDEKYIGEPLTSVMSQFYEIAEYKAPNFFFLSHSHERSYKDMNYSDSRYRLLGLFRLWNAMEYYYPYRDIIDDDWNELLIEFIPKIIEGSDRLSYELNLSAIAAKLGDAHVSFSDLSYLYDQFGIYTPPVRLTKVDGKLVVLEITGDYADNCPLELGDILLELDGVDIVDVVSNRKQYLSIPNEEKLLIVLSPFLLRSHNYMMDITVLRDGMELALVVKGYPIYVHASSEVSVSHQLLDKNIGLINPSMLSPGEIHTIMKEFANTDGLIIDLRQYPRYSFMDALSAYLLDDLTPFAIISIPSIGVPGVFVDGSPVYSGGGYSSYKYERTVVILMDETSMSESEFTIMSLRNSPNVTVMGSNSIGADGNVKTLPLPGGLTMIYTGVGVYTSEGGRTQRIGLSPDIYVERTIAGIREGRDELIEAAIQLILEHLIFKVKE